MRLHGEETDKSCAKDQIRASTVAQQHSSTDYLHLTHDKSQDLENQGIPVTRNLEEALMLVHSYVLVKLLVKQADHDTGARLLVHVYVSKNRCSRAGGTYARDGINPIRSLLLYGVKAQILGRQASESVMVYVYVCLGVCTLHRFASPTVSPNSPSTWCLFSLRL